MSDKLIDYEDIMQTIRNNFAEVMDEDENYYYGCFKKTNRFDSHNQPIYLQLKKNFNNK